MLKQLNTPIGRLRIAAILEGISYLLFGLTMPLKYLLDIPGPNYVVGLAHGILFIIYIYLCIINAIIYKWNGKTTLLVLLASLIPLATFIADAKVFKKQQAQLMN